MSADVARLRAVALLDAGRAADALEHARRAVAAAPEAVRAWWTLSRCHVHLEQWGDALAAADRGAALEPEDVSGHQLRTLALIGLGRHDEAVSAAETAVAARPGVWRSHTHLARALLYRHDVAGRADDLGRAREAAVEALRLAPDESRCHWMIGTVHSVAGDTGAAREAFRAALHREPGDAAVLYRLGWEELRGRRHRAAADLFAEALAAEPDHGAARRGLDWIFADLVLYPLLIVGALCLALNVAWFAGAVWDTAVPHTVRAVTVVAALTGGWGVMAARIGGLRGRVRRYHLTSRCTRRLRSHAAAATGALIAGALLPYEAAVWAFPIAGFFTAAALFARLRLARDAT